MIIQRLRAVKCLLFVIVILLILNYIINSWLFTNEVTFEWAEKDSSQDQFLDNEQKCKVPKLNPYHPDVLPFLPKSKPEECTMKKHAHVTSNGVLRLKAENVQRAGIYYIKRIDDFNIELSKRISLLEHEPNPSDRPTNPSDCSYNCKNDGRCDYCGAEGYCCRKGYGNCPINLIQQASRDYHSCVYPIDDKEVIIECWHGCGERGGRCPSICGTDGYCCQNGFDDCSDYLQSIALIDEYSCVHTPPFQDVDINYQLTGEFVRLDLVMENKYFEEYYAFVSKPSEEDYPRKDTEINIVMIMLDSVSNAVFQRSMKKSYKMLTDDPNSFIFMGQSIVGDGTTAQLCAMLTGTPEHLLPEARKRMEKSEAVDRWPFIFKDLHNMHYRTLFSEDDPQFATFNYRLHGFNAVPTTKYLRPYWIALDNLLAGEGPSCSNKIAFSYLKEYFNAYRKSKKFALTILTSLTHNTLKSVELADNDIIDYFEFLNKSGYLNNTAVILFGDHGLRVSGFRSTLQGKLEERLPFMSITLPSWFQSFRAQMKNMKDNTKIMTSHFDIYSTLQHMMTFPRTNNKANIKFGKSLFSNIKTLNRTCEQAGVAKHWCPCFDFHDVSVEDRLVKDVAARTINRMNYLNNKDKDTKGKCSSLVLNKIIRAGRQNPSKTIEKFLNMMENSQCDSCGVLSNNSVHIFHRTYQVTFSVYPSGGEYEATADCLYNEILGKHTFQKLEISRTNLYGSQPDCISKEFPHLRKYCFCK